MQAPELADGLELEDGLEGPGLLFNLISQTLEIHRAPSRYERKIYALYLHTVGPNVSVACILRSLGKEMRSHDLVQSSLMSEANRPEYASAPPHHERSLVGTS